MPDKRDDSKIRRRKVSDSSNANVRVKKRAGSGMNEQPQKSNKVVSFRRDREVDRRATANRYSENGYEQNPRRYNSNSYDREEYYEDDYYQDDNSRQSNDRRRPKKRSKKRFRLFGGIRRRFLKKFITVLLVLIVVLGSGGFLYVRSITKDMPPLTKQMVRESYINKNPVPLAKIPKTLQNAVIAVEDHRFYEHGGVDYISMIRATVSTLTGGKRQGGSTIDMQVSKNLLTSNEISIKRKIQDMYNAYRLNKIMTKKEILEAYLNNIYMGKSAYGVQAGANLYFGKDVWKLGFGQCTMLAGITNNPNLYQNYEEAKKRQALILYRMYDLGYIKEYVYKAQLLRDTPFKSEIDK